MGRPPVPTKLTKETTDRLEALLMAGLCLRHACRAVDIHPDTVYSWLKASKDGTVEPYGEFFRRIKKARVGCELFWLEQLKKRRSWTRWAWLLERSFPVQWRSRDPDKRAPRNFGDRPEDGDDIIAEIEAILAESRNGSP